MTTIHRRYSAILNSIDAIQKSHVIPNLVQVNTSSVSPAQGFGDILKAAMCTDAVVGELEALGVHVTVRAVPNNPESLRSHANTVSSFGSVTIAPNILEEMANDSEVRLKYVNKIENWISGGAEHAARVSAMGGNLVHRSMVIHEDGSVTYISMVSCDPADDDDDDDIYEVLKNDVVSFYDKLDDEGAGQHLVVESMPVDRNGYFIAHQFVSLIPHDPQQNRNSNRLTFGRHQAEAIIDNGGMLDYKMLSSAMADSLVRHYQQALK